MSEEKVWSGGCFCGAVKLTVIGDPEGMGYCHCESCRRWSAGPVNAFSLWKPESVEITQGKENIVAYSNNPLSENPEDIDTAGKTPQSIRKWCKKCGGHILTEHPAMGLIDVYTAVMPDFPFHPGVHVHYQESKLQMKDGLPKMQDLPAEAGGSGIMIPE